MLKKYKNMFKNEKQLLKEYEEQYLEAFEVKPEETINSLKSRKKHIIKYFWLFLLIGLVFILGSSIYSFRRLIISQNFSDIFIFVVFLLKNIIIGSIIYFLCFSKTISGKLEYQLINRLLKKFENVNKNN